MDLDMFFREFPNLSRRSKELIQNFSPAILNWLGSYTNQRTIELNAYYISKFLAYHKITGEQLIEIAKNSIEQIRTMISIFRHHIMLNGQSSYSAYGYTTSVRSFLSYHNIQFKLGRSLVSRSPEHEEYYKLTNEQVRSMINYAPIARDKAILANLHQDGQRIKVYEGFKWGHVRKQIEKGEYPVIVLIPANFTTSRGESANKLKRDYYMVIPFEACQYIKAMIEERKRWGEEITDDSWLFRSYSCKIAGKLRRVDRRTPADQAMDDDTVEKVIDHSAKAIGIFAKNTKRRRIHAHTFRRSFETTLDDKLSENLLNFIMGRAIPLEVAHGIPSEKRGAYKIYSKEYIREKWIKHDCDMALNLGTSKELMEAYKIVDMMKTSGMSEDEVNEVYALLGAFASPEDAMKEIRKRAEDAMRVKIFGGGIRAKPKLQKIVDEAKLSGFLDQGFEIVTVLPSGKIVVKQ